MARRTLTRCPEPGCDATWGWEGGWADRHRHGPHEYCSCGWVGLRWSSHHHHQLGLDGHGDGHYRIDKQVHEQRQRTYVRLSLPRDLVEALDETAAHFTLSRGRLVEIVLEDWIRSYELVTP